MNFIDRDSEIKQLQEASRLLHRLEEIAPRLPFVKTHTLHLCLFLKEKPFNEAPGTTIYYPEDVLR